MLATQLASDFTHLPCAVCSATDDRSPLEVLREENQLLKETIASAENDTAALESQLSAGNTLLLVYQTQMCMNSKLQAACHSLCLIHMNRMMCQGCTHCLRSTVMSQYLKKF